MRHWFTRLRWPQLMVALMVSVSILAIFRPSGVLAISQADAAYTDPKLGFTLRLPNGWSAVPHEGQVSLTDTSSVEIASTSASAGLALTVRHGVQMAVLFSEKIKPNSHVGHYQALRQEFPADPQSPLPCSELTFLAGFDYVSASWCGSVSQGRHSDIEKLLATYQTAKPSFQPSRSAMVAAIPAPPSCPTLQTNYGVAAGYLGSHTLGAPTDTSPANGWFHYSPGTYVCSHPGSLDSHGNPDGWLFQCTELANRFVREQWGLGTLTEDGDGTFNNYLHGNAGTYFNYWNSSPIAGSTWSYSDVQPFADARWLNAYQQAWPGHNFTPSAPPQPGDLVIWQDVNNASLGPTSGFNPAAHTGHVAVVTGTDANFVYVAQQHYNNTSYFKGFTLQQSGSSYIIDSGNASGVTGRVAVGWLHFAENHNGSSAGTPFAVGYDYQGNPAAYARGADGSVSTKAQDANGNWSAWTSLGGSITSAPVFGIDYQGRSALYVRGADGALYTAVQGANGTWITHLDGNGDPNNWTSLGGVLVSDPAFGYDYLGRPAVYVVGTDGAVYTKVEGTNGVWGDFSSLGGTWTSNPAFGFDYQGNPAVFVRGTNGALNIRVQSTNGSWGGWIPVPGSLTSNPVVGHDYQGHPAVFVRGTDGALYITVQGTNGIWGAFTGVPGTLTSDPAFGYDYLGHPAVYVRGTTGAVYTTIQGTNGVWSAFSSLNGSFTSAPAFEHDYQARPAVFGLGTDSALYTAVQGTNGVWITHLDGNGDPNIWTSLGGTWQ
jgi:hypothetical protein